MSVRVDLVRHAPLVRYALVASLAVGVGSPEGLARPSSAALSSSQAEPMSLQEGDFLEVSRGVAADIRIHRWRRAGDSYDEQVVSVADPSGAGVDAIQAHPDGRILLVSAGGQTVAVYDSESGGLVRAEYPEHMFSAGAWGQDGSIYLYGRADKPDSVEPEYGLFRVATVGAEALPVFTADRGNWWVDMAVDAAGNLWTTDEGYPPGIGDPGALTQVFTPAVLEQHDEGIRVLFEDEVMSERDPHFGGGYLGQWTAGRGAATGGMVMAGLPQIGNQLQALTVDASFGDPVRETLCTYFADPDSSDSLLGLVVRSEIYVTRIQARTYTMSRMTELDGGACGFEDLFQFEVAVGDGDLPWTIFPDNLVQ